MLKNTMVNTVTSGRCKLGASSLETAPIVLGGNVFGWTADEQTSFQILDAFVDAGFNMIDTADSYSKWVPGHRGGESETIIGKWLKRSGKRSRVLLATKVGSDLGPDGKGLSRAHILRGVEESLKRLQTDHIDLYQSHVDDSDTALEETLETYAELVEQGKVRVIGASNFAPSRLLLALEVSRSLGYPRYQALQPLYNLYSRREFEAELEQICLENKLGVIPYFSLASGFLTGKYRSKADIQGAAREPFVGKYLNERGLRILQALDEVAARHKATPAQVALAWLIARPGVTAPIASATNLKQLDEILQSVNLELDETAMRSLNEASA